MTEMFQRKFVFGSTAGSKGIPGIGEADSEGIQRVSADALNSEGIQRVSAADLYSEEKGYGIVPLGGPRRADRFTGTGGWCPGPVYEGIACEEPAYERPAYERSAYAEPCGKSGREGDFRSVREGGVTASRAGCPLIFRAKVPGKGVYRVTVTLSGGERGCERLDLCTGRRNLVKRGLRLEPGEIWKTSFFVNVCEYLPVVGEPERLDDTIYVTVLESHREGDDGLQDAGGIPSGAQGGGENRRSQQGVGGNPSGLRNGAAESTWALTEVCIEEAQAPTVFLAGDSLVTDYEGQYPDNPLMNYGSWGQDLLSFLPGAAVSNQAHAGMTTNCFRDDGHFEIVRRNIRPGDVFMMQFGHNDQKRRYLKAYVQYAANLRWYIGRIRELGAYPVIVTSLSRIPGRDEEGCFDLLQEYAESCLRTGREMHVPVIDLHDYSFRKMCEAGTEASKDYFMDVTHTNDYGAMAAAQFIAAEIRRQKIEPLWRLMEGEAGREEGEGSSQAEAAGPAWKPDLTLRPAHAVSSAQKEEKPVLPHDLPNLPYADCVQIPKERELKEAMWRGLLDPCIRYFHPYDGLPRGQFLYLFFKAVRSPARRSYQGKYCDIYRYEWDASAVQAAVDGNLVDETTTPDARFRPDDLLTGGELASFLVRGLHPLEEREISLEECERQAGDLGLLWENYDRNGAVSRLDCVAALVRLMNLENKEAMK